MPSADREVASKRAKASHSSALAESSRQANGASGESSTIPGAKTQAVQKRPRRRARLFQPFRALGLITNDVPFALTIRHGGKDATKPDVHIVACIGNSWTMWDADRMTLLFVGEPLDARISALIVVGGSGGRDNIFAASGRAVHRFVRGQKAQVFAVDDDEGSAHSQAVNGTSIRAEGSPLAQLLSVGDSLIASSADGTFVFVWSIMSGNMLRRIAIGDLEIDGEKVTASAMLHPATYVDIVALGSAQGHLLIHNFRTAKYLYTFSRSKLERYLGIDQTTSASLHMTVVDLVQTPALDVVAVVFACGYVLLLNIRCDEPVLYARVNTSGATQRSILARGAVSFRTDGVADTMAIGTRMGDLILFDLNPDTDEVERPRAARLAHTMRAAHDAAIASVQFVQGQSLLITSGDDNAIKQWFFENDSVGQDVTLGGTQQASATSAPRLLKSREGHSAPPRLIRFIGEGGKTIVSAGGDDRSVRAISVVRDSRSTELSQGSLQKKANQTARPLISLKMSPVTTLSHSSTRSRDWDDLVTTHSGVTYSQSWSLRNARMGKHQLAATSSDKASDASEATASSISACGNFAFVGNAEGYIEMYNIQSGRYRRRYDTRVEVLEKVAKRTKGGVVHMREERRRARGSAVTGIVADATNKTVAVSTMSGGLFFYDFTSATQIAHVDTIAGVSSLLLHRPTNLVAALQDDLTIAIYDMETFKKVRVFGGFGAKILDATFSPDGRWLIATSLDSFVRTFDIPTSRLVDYFHTEQIATSVTFSPLGDFLATTHVASRGIFLWANRNQYLHLALSGIDEEEVLRSDDVQESLPTLRGLDVSELDEEDAGLRELDAGEAELQRTYTSQPQLFLGDDANAESSGLVTLSSMPRSRWMTLLNLDVISARNKPKEAPKKPERAPFFLPVGASSVPDSALNKRGYDFFGDAAGGEQPDEPQSRRLQTLGSQGLDYESEFSARLAGALQDDEMDALFSHLHTLAPPSLDAEIRSLTRLRDITRFLQCMTRRLQQHLDYDAVQAMVAVALRVHSDVIVENGVKQPVGEEDEDADELDGESLELAEAVRALMEEQYRASERVADLLQYCMGSLAFVRDVPLI